jgi:hypothetical protein
LSPLCVCVIGALTSSQTSACSPIGSEPPRTALPNQGAAQRRSTSGQLRLSRRSSAWKDAKILLLRHQIALVERHGAARPKLTWADRSLIAALLAVIPRPRRAGPRLPATPATILRWHRDLVKRR